MTLTWVEAAVRAHAWVYSDGSVPPGSSPDGPSIGEVPASAAEQAAVVFRMLRAPECVFDTATAKHLMAHLVVARKLYDSWQPLRPYTSYVRSDGLTAVFSDEAAAAYTRLEQEAVRAIGLERWSDLYVQLLHELYLM